MPTTLRLAIILAATWASLLLAAPAAAQPLPGSLLPYPDPPEMQAPGLGFSLAVDGEWMIVGAPVARIHDWPLNRDCVIMYRRSAEGTWSEHQRFLPSTPPSTGLYDRMFGRAVAISGEYAAIGGGSFQSVLLYRLLLDEWVLVDEWPLIPNGARSRRLEFDGMFLYHQTIEHFGKGRISRRHVTPQGQFGNHEVLANGEDGVASFDVHEGELLWTTVEWSTNPGAFHAVQIAGLWVTKKIDSSLGIREGACLLTDSHAFWSATDDKVHVASRDGGNWAILEPISRPFGPEIPAMYLGRFGQEIRLVENSLVISSTRNMDDGYSISLGSGVTVLFIFGQSGVGWEFQGIVEEPSPRSSGGFGHSMDYSEGQLIVGAPSYVPSLVHIMEMGVDSWEVRQSLDGDGAVSEWGLYGTSLDITDEHIFVGAPGGAPEPYSLGCVLMYPRSSQGLGHPKVIVPQPFEPFYFGYSVASDGSRLAVAARDSPELFIYNIMGDEVVREGVYALPSGQPVTAAVEIKIDGDVIAVGQIGSIEPLVVARHDGATWQTEALLSHEFLGNQSAILQSLDLTGGQIIASARYTEESVVQGVVYLYRFDGTGWSRVQEVTGPVGSEPHFGQQVGFIDGGAAVGLYDSVAKLGNVMIYDFVEGVLVESRLLVPNTWLDLKPTRGNFATSADSVAVATNSVSTYRLFLREEGIWRPGPLQPFLESGYLSFLSGDPSLVERMVTDSEWVLKGLPTLRNWTSLSGTAPPVGFLNGGVVAWVVSEDAAPSTAPLNVRAVGYRPDSLLIAWDPDPAFVGRVSLYLDEAPADAVTLRGGALSSTGEAWATGLLPDRVYKGAAEYQTIGGIGPQTPFTAITNAAVPSTPSLDQVADASMRVKVTQGSNREGTLVAVQDRDRQLYIQADGMLGPDPHWRPVSEWTNGVVATGLDERAIYYFAARALGQNGNETAFSPYLSGMTLDFTAPRTRVLGPAEPIIATGFPGSYTLQVDLQLEVEYTGAAPARTVISVSTDGVDFAPVQTLGAGVTTFTLLLEDYDLAAPGQLRVRSAAKDTSNNVEVPDPTDDLILSIQRGPGPHNSFVVQ